MQFLEKFEFLLKNIMQINYIVGTKLNIVFLTFSLISAIQANVFYLKYS